ncbi:hypothetical protein [Neobacillus sp. D3-1R]|uniref:hypothetical protein n=1 Tax=Neobacillus sp. D3-1R TaxID=3445778 RepID=UPI003F9F4D91
MHTKRLLGFISGYFSMSIFLHSIKAYAMGVQLQSAGERIGAVGTGLVILLLIMIILKKWFSPSFFHGFLVATGLFLSFDIVVFHWFFHLHRITSGPEANWLEPIFVVFGIALFFYGLKREKTTKLYQETAVNENVYSAK